MKNDTQAFLWLSIEAIHFETISTISAYARISVIYFFIQKF